MPTRVRSWAHLSRSIKGVPKLVHETFAMLRHPRATSASLLLALSLTLPLGCNDSDDDDGGDDVSDAAYCDEVEGWDPSSIDFEDQVLELVNQRRSEGAVCGTTTFDPAGPLVMDPALRCAARKHSLDMATRNFFDHNTPEGLTPWDRTMMAEYDANAIGENIAAGQPTPEDVMTAWMGSTGHCMNIMNPAATELGVGYVVAGPEAMYSVYWTQVFGQREQ